MNHVRKKAAAKDDASQGVVRVVIYLRRDEFERVKRHAVGRFGTKRWKTVMFSRIVEEWKPSNSN